MQRGEQPCLPSSGTGTGAAPESVTSGQTALEILVGKTPHHLQFTRPRLEGADVRVPDTVESRGFHHGVMGHVEKRQSVTGSQGLIEGPVADDIPGKARGA